MLILNSVYSEITFRGVHYPEESPNAGDTKYKKTTAHISNIHIPTREKYLHEIIRILHAAMAYTRKKKKRENIFAKKEKI